MLSASRVIAAPVGDIGAPRRLIGRAHVLSVRLNCSTPRFDRSDGPHGACLKGAGSPAAVIVSLIPGLATVVQTAPAILVRRRSRSEPSDSISTYSTLSRAFASAVQRPNSQSEANRGAVAPEPKEWS